MNRERKAVLNWGYRLDWKKQYNCNYGMGFPVDSHCHALITGASGSGKSMATIYMLGKLLQICPDIHITICDFKNSDTFRFLQVYPHYYAGDRCFEGVMDYYEHFTFAREQGIAEKRHLLIFDEYPGALGYWKGQDKRKKTDKSVQVMNVVSEVLCLGRSIGNSGNGFGVWCVCQRASAEIFPMGSRDNYMILVLLGRTSREQRQMLLSGEDIPEGRIYQPGEGLLLADGAPLTEVCFPLIADMENWKGHILDILMKNSQ